MDWKLIIEIVCRVIAGIAFAGTFASMWLSNYYPWAKKCFEFFAELTFWIGWCMCLSYCVTGFN